MAPKKTSMAESGFLQGISTVDNFKPFETIKTSNTTPSSFWGSDNMMMGAHEQTRYHKSNPDACEKALTVRSLENLSSRNGDRSPAIVEFHVPANISSSGHNASALRHLVDYGLLVVTSDAIYSVTKGRTRAIRDDDLGIIDSVFNGKELHLLLQGIPGVPRGVLSVNLDTLSSPRVTELAVYPLALAQHNGDLFVSSSKNILNVTRLESRSAYYIKNLASARGRLYGVCIGDDHDRLYDLHVDKPVSSSLLHFGNISDMCTIDGKLLIAESTPGLTNEVHQLDTATGKVVTVFPKEWDHHIRNELRLGGIRTASGTTVYASFSSHIYELTISDSLRDGYHFVPSKAVADIRGRIRAIEVLPRNALKRLAEAIPRWSF